MNEGKQMMRRQYTPKEKARMRQLRKEGMTHDQIGAKLAEEGILTASGTPIQGGTISKVLSGLRMGSAIAAQPAQTDTVPMELRTAIKTILTMEIDPTERIALVLLLLGG